MEALLIAVVGTLNIVCFFVGAKVGQTAAKGKEIETPVVKNPLDAVRQRQNTKEAKKELERIDIIRANMERYDGTSNGQADVPRG